MTQVLDMAVVDELVALSDDGEPLLLLELIQLFLDDGPQKIQSVVVGLAGNDFEKMEAAAHSLKGSAGNLGARMLQSVCERMQQASRQRLGGEVKTLASQMQTEFVQAKAALENLRQRYARA